MTDLEQAIAASLKDKKMMGQKEIAQAIMQSRYEVDLLEAKKRSERMHWSEVLKNSLQDSAPAFSSSSCCLDWTCCSCAAAVTDNERAEERFKERKDVGVQLEELDRHRCVIEQTQDGEMREALIKSLDDAYALMAVRFFELTES